MGQLGDTSAMNMLTMSVMWMVVLRKNRPHSHAIRNFTQHDGQVGYHPSAAPII